MFGFRNLTLDQYLGLVSNSKTKIHYSGAINLKKGKWCNFVRFVTMTHSINVVLHWGSMIK